TVATEPSFPQKWESRISDFQIIFEYCCCSKVWIPALYDALYQRGALIFLTFPFDSQVKGAFLCQQ
ncbi:TPA: hypothetical protein ACLAYP_001961, partial [Neisseria meningitidis]